MNGEINQSHFFKTARLNLILLLFKADNMHNPSF